MSQDKKVGRNDPCICGSGKKFKNCCALISNDLRNQSMPPQLQSQISSWLDVAFSYHSQMRFADAEVICRQILSLMPVNAEATHLIGLMAFQLGQYSVAVEYLSRAIAYQPNFDEAHNNLGLVKQSLGKVEEAKTHFEKAIALNPNFALAYNNLGSLIYEAFDEYDKAITLLNKAAEIEPNSAMIYYNLGNAYSSKREYQTAIMAFQKAISLDPRMGVAYHELGAVLFIKNEISNAIENYRKAIECNPDLAVAYRSLGMAMQRTWQLEESIQFYRKAHELKPNDADLFDDMLFVMQHSQQLEEEKLFEAYKEYAQKFESPFYSQWGQYKNSQVNSRRLKIGYVSADLRNHAVTNFMEPVLSNHSHDEFEIFCYYNNTYEDNVKLRLKSLADHWIDCVEMNTDNLVRRIRDDRIDILVDLSGHTAGNRLAVFTKKPAPIQVSWMGYVGSVGLKCIDYRLTDCYAEPIEQPPYSQIEQPWMLNPIWYVYRPCIKNPKLRNTDMLKVKPSPAIENGYITFASFNTIIKITENAIRLWTEVLNRIPRSKLILVTKGNDPARENVLNKFAALGLSKDRVKFLDYAKEDHYLFYHQVDISLDTFPYNGGTTTCDAVWMGVPVITLAGKVFRSRMGVTIANNVGHPEWVANNEEEYIEKAVILAQDVSKLNLLRLGLRDEMERSPLMDEAGFTQKLELAFREMWLKYCNSEH